MRLQNVRIKQVLKIFVFLTEKKVLETLPAIIQWDEVQLYATKIMDKINQYKGNRL